MIIFWLATASMVAIALAFVIPALAGRTRSGGVARKQLNINIHKERLQELETELQNGVLSQDQYEQARAELQRNLLRDVEGDDDALTTAHPPPLSGAIMAAVTIPVLAIALYLMLGDPQSIHTAPRTLAQSDQQTADMHSIEQMMQQLRDKLQREPNNVEGWLLLARSYVTQQRYDDAAKTYARAYELRPNDGQVMADYAEALALANNSRLEGLPADLAARALKLEPDNPKALWLSAMAAMQRGEREVAVAHLQRLQELLPPGSEGAQLVRSFLEQAIGKAAVTPEPSRPVPPPATAAVGGTRLEVKVALDPTLAARAAPKDTVFIYAQASQGPRMPLAIVRQQVQTLPATVVLDDSMAMTPAMKLSQFDKVVIGARVSKSGVATPQSGDLEGSSGVITLNTTKSVDVIIDRVVP